VRHQSFLALISFVRDIRKDDPLNRILYLVASVISLFCMTADARQHIDGPSHDVSLPTFDPSRDAAKDIQDAVVKAQHAGKRILLDVGGEWCIWCHRLDTLFAENKDLADFLHQHFVLVKINFSPENKNQKVLRQFPKIPGYPHFFVLETNGKLLHSQNTGELESGKHHDREKVFAFLKKWALPATRN
jgi:thioredoxin-related protein